jgi:hypothetical protein
VTGLSFALTVALIQIGAGNQALLLVLAAAIAIVLGMGMPTVGVYVLLAALVAPALTEVGVPPLAAHMFVLYFGMMSMTTPPVAVAAYAGTSIAQADSCRPASRRVASAGRPTSFHFCSSCRRSAVAGQPVDVVLAAATAIMGIYLVSVTVAGFHDASARVWPSDRIRVAGLLLMIPANGFPGDLTDVAGFILGVVLIGSELGVLRRPPSDAEGDLTGPAAPRRCGLRTGAFAPSAASKRAQGRGRSRRTLVTSLPAARVRAPPPRLARMPPPCGRHWRGRASRHPGLI